MKSLICAESVLRAMNVFQSSLDDFGLVLMVSNVSQKAAIAFQYAHWRSAVRLALIIGLQSSPY